MESAALLPFVQRGNGLEIRADYRIRGFVGWLPASTRRASTSLTGESGSRGRTSDNLLPSSSIPAGRPVHVRRRPRSRAQRRDRAPATADEIVKVNEESRIDGLRSAATVFALLALIALPFTGGSQPSNPAPRPNPGQSGIEGPGRSARCVSKGAVRRRSTRLLGWGWKGALSARPRTGLPQPSCPGGSIGVPRSRNCGSLVAVIMSPVIATSAPCAGAGASGHCYVPVSAQCCLAAACRRCPW